MISHSNTNPIVFLAVLILVASTAHADEFADRNNHGNKLLEEGKITEAISAYQAARVERPEEPGAVYNLGSAYHLKGAFDTAITELQAAIAHVEADLKPKAYYNLGNTFYRSQEYAAAIEAYKQALIADPSDRDAKHNLEMALRQMNEQDSTAQNQQQENQEQNKEDSSGQQNQNPQPQDQGDSTQSQQQQTKQGEDPSQQQQPEQEQQGQPREQRQPRPLQGMTKADAERLLDALKQNELALQKRRAQRATDEKVVKDW